MQLQFHKTVLPCLQRVKGETLTQEETQELRLPEDMPDIGTVLGAWGQVLVRGKEWRAGSMELSCGVMVWVMYMPEEGGDPRMAEAWIPFSFKWELPDTDRDGTIRACCLLRGVDARATSARKLMLRATVGALGEAWVHGEGEIATPDAVPEDIRLLKKMYPILIPREAGEKAFSLDEELTLPASAPRIEKLLRFSLLPEIIDKKIMAGKVVFRGAALLHILYKADDGGLYSWDFEQPFSQFSDLEHEYGADAGARICMAVTALDCDLDMEGRLHLKAGLTGQYVINDRANIELVEDAYSPNRMVTVNQEELQLPTILEEQMQTLHAEQTAPVEGSRVVDVAFYPDQPRQNRGPDNLDAELTGQFMLLCYDSNGMLQSAAPKWHVTWSLPADQESQVQMMVSPSGVPQGTLGTEATLRGDILLDIQTTALRGLPMVTGLEVGEETEPDPNRPSLILRRAGQDTLWQVAKATGSTVEAIREINALKEEPNPDQMLLIPVL